MVGRCWKSIREIKVKRWREKTADREEWVSVIKEAKGLRELYSQRPSKKVGLQTLFNCLSDTLCEWALCLPSSGSGLLCYITASSASCDLLWYITAHRVYIRAKRLAAGSCSAVSTWLSRVSFRFTTPMQNPGSNKTNFLRHDVSQSQDE